MKTVKKYIPFLNGKFEIAAGLKTFDSNQSLFEIDENYDHYIDIKSNARDENLDKYYPRGSKLSELEHMTICEYMIENLIKDYSHIFKYNNNVLKNLKTEETIQFENFYNVRSDKYKYRDLFDALCTQIQEDCSIWKLTEKDEFLGSIHLCYPNHWNPSEKLNRNFIDVHEPVADFEKLNRASLALVKQIVHKGPFIRFAWGISTDTVLNHHPDNKYKGRSFDPSKPELYIRVERQTTSPFPDIGLSLFTIRTYFIDCEKDLQEYERNQLVKAIKTMSNDTQKYKGLLTNQSEIIKWLSSLNHS